MHLSGEKGNTVSCQSATKQISLLSFFLCQKFFTDTSSRQWNTWLHDSVAPVSRDTLMKTHNPTYVTLPMAFCVTRWIIHAPQSRGNISLCKGAASKFCFLWAALFLEHIYKQKLVCWQWISSLCDRTGLGLGRFCVLPVLTLAWEKLKLL